MYEAQDNSGSFLGIKHRAKESKGAELWLNNLPLVKKFLNWSIFGSFFVRPMKKDLNKQSKCEKCRYFILITWQRRRQKSRRLKANLFLSKMAALCFIWETHRNDDVGFFSFFSAFFFLSREKMAQAYDFALEKMGMDINSYQIWNDYVKFLKGVDAVGSYAENQKISAIRKVYQKGIFNPMIHIEQFWYETFKTKTKSSFLRVNSENKKNPIIASFSAPNPDLGFRSQIFQLNFSNIRIPSFPSNFLIIALFQPYISNIYYYIICFRISCSALNDGIPKNPVSHPMCDFFLNMMTTTIYCDMKKQLTYIRTHNPGLCIFTVYSV